MSLWFVPVCDDLLKTIALWHANYENGEVFSDRKWMNLDGVVVDRPTRYAHRVAFKPNEMQHLVRIMQTLEPKNPLTEDLQKVESGLRRGRLLPGGKYVVTLAYYKEDIREIYETLIRAKTGQLETLETTIEKQKQDGKDLFEV